MNSSIFQFYFRAGEFNQSCFMQPFPLSVLSISGHILTCVQAVDAAKWPTCNVCG